MSVDDRALRRRPLSDRTNAAASPSSLSSSSSSKQPPSSLPNPSKLSLRPKRLRRAPENPGNPTAAFDDAQNPRSLPDRRRTPARNSPASGTDDCVVVKSMTVYNRRRRAEKRKNMEEPITFPSLEIISRTGDKFNGPAKDVGLSKSCTMPLHKHKKMRQSQQAEGVSGQDYIEQQRAYFAEIDAFELPEEEATVSDLE